MGTLFDDIIELLREREVRMEPLVKKIRAIEAYSLEAGFDRNTPIRLIIEKYRIDNELLDDVIKGKTTFYKEVSHLYKKFGGKESLFPKSASYEQAKVKDLEKIIGKDIGVSSDWIIDLINNPFGFGLIGAVIGYGISHSGEKDGNERKSTDSTVNKYISRRLFLKRAKSLGIGMLLGSTAGFLGSGVKNILFYNAIKKAEYIDAKIQEVYLR